MNISKIIRESILREEKFHQLSDKIEFTFDLHHDEGGHTRQRYLQSSGSADIVRKKIYCFKGWWRLLKCGYKTRTIRY